MSLVVFQREEQAFPCLWRKKTKGIKGHTAYLDTRLGSKHSSEKTTRRMNFRWGICYLGEVGGALVLRAQEHGRETVITGAAAAAGGDLLFDMLERGTRTHWEGDPAPLITRVGSSAPFCSLRRCVMLIIPLQAPGTEQIASALFYSTNVQCPFALNSWQREMNRTVLQSLLLDPGDNPGS